MKGIVLTLSCSLLAASLVGMARGPVATGARVEAEPDTTGITSIRLDHHEQPAEVQRADWLPEPHQGRVLAADETVRVLTVEQWRAIRHLPDEYQYVMTRAGWCESHLNPAARIIDVDGLPRVGAWMVGEQWWGAVPADLEGQAIQVAGILREHGTWPWAASIRGCEGWSA